MAYRSRLPHTLYRLASDPPAFRARRISTHLASVQIVSAVERQIEIIGEAARRVSDAFQAAHPEIPWRVIVGQRHVLAHDYGEIKHERIWRVVTEHVPRLIEQIEPLIPPPPAATT